jgi:hypothetical protein
MNLNGQTIIVGIILLLCVLFVIARLIRFFKKDKACSDKKCEGCNCGCKR